MPTTLQQFREKLKGHDCRWCRNVQDGVTHTVPLHNESIQHYNHDGGYVADGFQERQWLYVECPSCGYQWSLVKLGVKDEVSEVTHD